MSIAVVVRMIITGPSTPVFLRHHPPRLRVLARAGDGQFAFALQELQRVAGPFRPFLLHNRQHLVFQVGVTEVIQALPGHGRILDALLLRHERKDGVHQRGFARRARALDDDRQRFVQFSRYGRKIARQFVGRFPNDPAPLVVGEDPLQQVRSAQQFQRLLALPVAHRGDGRKWLCHGGLDAFLLHRFQLQEQFAHVPFDQLAVKDGLFRRLLDEMPPLLVLVKVDDVDVK